MRKVILAVMALMIILSITGQAYAGQNLKAESVEGLYGTYKDGAITLNWNANVVDRSNSPTTATNIIRIYRGEKRDMENDEIGYVDVDQKVDNADLGPEMHKVMAFSFTDSSVEKGKTYYYKVECGSVGYKWARTSVIAEDPAKLMDEKRKKYEEQSDWSERMAGSLLLAVPNYFMRVLDLYDPLELVFQVQVKKSENLKDKTGEYLLKTPGIVMGGKAVRGEIERVGSNIVDTARGIVVLVGVIVIILAGIVFAGSYNDPNKIVLAKRILAGLIVCLFIVFAAEKIAGTSLGIIGYTPTSTVTADPNPISADDTFLHTFTGKEFDALSTYYDRLNEFVPVSLVVVIVLLGMGALYTSTNPNAKLSFREYAVGLFAGLIVLKFGIYVLSVLFDINYAIVKFFQWIVGDKLDASFLDTLINTNTMSLGQAIITFVAVFAIGVINWQYTIRKIVIALLIGLIPVVAVIAMLPSRRNALDYWFKELISQVFLQTAHAAVLSFGILLIQVDANFWVELACIMGLPSIAVVVRRVMGAESFGSGLIGGMGSMMGIGSLLALGRILAPRLPNKIPGKEALSGVMDSVAGGTGGIVNNPAMGMMGKLAGFGLRTASTLSGAAAGGILAGALTGNPAMGAGAGAMLGSALGGGVTDIAGKAGNILKMSPDEKAQAMGVADTAMLDDPGVAYAAGKRLFGDGILGKTVSAGYAGVKAAQGYFGMTNPGAASQVKSSIADTQRSLRNAKTQLAEYKPVYDEAKANYTQTKNLYSPKSSYMRELQAQIEPLEIQKNIKENDYLEALNYMNNNFDAEESISQGASWKEGAAAALTRLAKAEAPYREAKEKLSAAQIELTMGNAIHECSGRRLEATEAEYAKRQAAVSGLEQRLTTDGIRKEFEKLRQPQVNPNTEIAWR
ncbi:MAG: hypothetical protein K6T65_07895 [Peptococcaceae bacterium]|nr:hypothetical protein [Peptococcaceae bacterium]